MDTTSEIMEWFGEQNDNARDDSWVCDTLEKAEGCARRLRVAVGRLEEIDAVADRMIADANAWRKEASARYEANAEAERQSIATYLRMRIGEGDAKSIKLPYNVEASARKTGGTLEFADGFADSAPDDVVRVKRVIDVKAAKAYYRVADGVVVDPNGEVVEGVTVKPVTDSMKVVTR